MTLADSLLKFCSKIRIPREEIRESVNEGLIDAQITVAVWSAVTADDLKDLASAFGAGLVQMSLGDGGNFPLLEIKNGRVPSNVERTLRSIAHSNRSDLPLRLELYIDKAKIPMVAELSASGVYGKYLFYLFSANLLTLLKATLPSLDGLLFADRHRPSLAIASDAEWEWHSQMLRVMGESNSEYLSKATPEINNRDLRDSIDRFHEIRQSYLSWAGFDLDHITPVHLLRTDDGKDSTLRNAEVEKVFARHLLHVLILYTANRSSHEDKTYLVHFDAAERTSSLRLDPDKTPALERDVLQVYARWPFDGRHTDRLLIVQSVVSRHLLGIERPDENFSIFCSRLGQILGDAKWNYRAFADGKVNRHFELCDEASSYAVKISSDVSQAIDTITKGLVDTILGTVGLVVLTLIAALVENKSHGELFRYGTLAYAGYLFMFHLCYRMRAIYEGYKLTTEEAADRLAAFESILGSEKFAEIGRILGRRKDQFKHWFIIILLIYVVVIIGLGLLAQYLPGYLVAIQAWP